jgi:hypothetical protein
METEGSPPRPEGNLGEQDLPDLVHGLSRRLWTGVLILGRAGVEVRLSLKDGRMVFASSSDPDSRLGTLLLRRGALTLRQLVDGAKAITPGKRLGTILVEQGTLAAKDLVRAVVDQTQEIIYGAFQWTEGRYRLEEGAESNESITLNINTPSVILEGIRRIESWSRIEHAVGGLDARYVRCGGQEATIQQMSLSSDALELVGFLGEARDVEFLCTQSRLSSFEVCRTLWAFRVIGVVRRLAVATERPLDDDGLEFVLDS